MTPKEEMRIVINDVLEQEVNDWGETDGLADKVLAALGDAGFVPTGVEYRACVDATLFDPEEDETYTDGLVCFEREDRAMAEADLAPLHYRGEDVVSEDKYLERRFETDWRRVK